MNGILAVIGIAFFALQVLMIVKFFQIAVDMRSSKAIQLQLYKLQLFGSEKQIRANKEIFNIETPKCHISTKDDGCLVIFDDTRSGMLYFEFDFYYYKDDADRICFSTKENAIKGLYLYLFK